MTLITSQQVILDLATTDRSDAIRTLAETLVPTGRLTDLEGFLRDVDRREAQMATGLPGGVAIPHSRSQYAAEPSLVFGRSEHGIAWGANDGPARLIFLIAVPAGGDTDQLAILAKLARRLTKASFRDDLLTLTDPEAVADLLDREVVHA